MNQLKQFSQQLTGDPGVYRMLNASGTVIYVGKAKNLRSRVSSYFSQSNVSVKTRSLMKQVNDIEVTITSTENEALILEANLIKQLRPKYNVLMRDDKSYPFLHLNTQHDYPRLDLYRGTSARKGKLFGPYPNVGAVRDNLNFLQKLFKLRQCSDTFFASRRRPCLQYQIGRCTAPCVDWVSKTEYAAQVKQVKLYLSGNNEAVVETLQDQMQRFARQKQYEKAAEVRDKIAQIREITQRRSTALKAGDVDVFSVLQEAGDCIVVLLMIRQGQVLGHRSFYPVVPQHESVADALAAFLVQFYLQPVNQHADLTRIVLTSPIEQKRWLESALDELLPRPIKLINGKHHRYRSWCELAEKNACNDLQQRQHRHSQFTQQLSSLQQALSVSEELVRVECFDISHTSGQNTVASCVVFDRLGSQRRQYRCFNIKDITPGDDYAAMRQALMRRYLSLKKRELSMPSMVIIDGGKGQLRQAFEVMEELQINDVLLLAVAKGVSRKPGCESVFLSGQAKSIPLLHDSAALHCIQVIRDEAHRFAITSHRKQRAKRAISSNLESIPGIGAMRRQAILQHFGGFQGVSKASVSDIVQVPGFSQSLAQKIHDFIHRK